MNGNDCCVNATRPATAAEVIKNDLLELRDACAYLSSEASQKLNDFSMVSAPCEKAKGEDIPRTLLPPYFSFLRETIKEVRCIVRDIQDLVDRVDV